MSVVDILRKQLIKLQKEREEITLEKGLAARDNNDLRENFAYDYWVSQEELITARIFATLKEIEHFYSTYKKLQHKEVEVKGFRSKKEAQAAFEEGLELYAKQYKIK